MKEKFSFIHAADLHLDSPFRGFEQISYVDGKVKNNILTQLRNCTFTALDNIVKECIRNKVDFLVLSGDIFDLSVRSVRAELRFKKAMALLDEKGIEVFIAYGNHDYDEGVRARLTWPENVYFFSAGEVDCKKVERNGKEIARVYGISYPQRDVKENYALRFKKDRESPFAVGVLHSNVGGVPEHENYAPCSLEDLVKSGMDYWALGHVHSKAILRNNHPYVIYPGTPQGRNPRETGEKGCYLVNVADDYTVNLDFLTVDSIRWDEIYIPIEGMQAEDELLEYISDELTGKQEVWGHRSIITRILLYGRGPLHGRLKNETVKNDILAEIRSRFTVEEGYFIWPDSIECRTGFSVDRESLEYGQTLLSDLLAIGREAYSNPDLRKELYQSIVALDEKAYSYLSPPESEELEELVEEALDLAVDLLWEED